MGIRTSTSRPSIPRSPRLFLAPPPTPRRFPLGLLLLSGSCGPGVAGAGAGAWAGVLVDRPGSVGAWGGWEKARRLGWGVSGVAVFFLWLFFVSVSVPHHPLPPSPRRGCLCLFIPTSVYLNKHSRSACLFLRVAGGLYVGSRGRDGV